MLKKVKTYRSIWISDVHLGTRGSKAKELLEFFSYNDSEYLYLVGDIIDGWRITKKWYWPQDHNDVIQKLLRKARKGTKIIFIPGNHDEGARHFIGFTFGLIKIKNQAFHWTLKKKKLWITHGDLFDTVIQHARWLAYVGDNVNIASRLESLSKKFECELVVSRYVAIKANMNTHDLQPKKVKIRGRKDRLEIFTFNKGSEVIL